MKILVVFTGGTIGSTESDGYISTDADKSYKLLNLYKQYAEKQGVADNVEFDMISPYHVLSENNTCKTFIQLSKCFEKIDFNAYDGIILTHGTDTLQYTAAFMGYIMGYVNMPIVLVSANYVLEDLRSNGVVNFYYAVRFICLKYANGVFVSYKNSGDYPKIHRAVRVIEHQVYSDEIYSVCNSFYGYFKDGEFICNENKKSFKSASLYEAVKSDCGTKSLDYQTENIKNYILINANKGYVFNVPDMDLADLASDIIQIHPYPGMKYPELDDNVKAVLHYTYHSGTICSISPDLKEFAHTASLRNIPIFITGAGEGSDYESVKCYDELEFIVLPVASPAAMYVKLWLCIINNINKDEIINVMRMPVANDVVE